MTACILHWWITLSFVMSSSAIDGGDQIASIITFLLIPLCLTDKRKSHWGEIKAYSSPLNLVGITSIILIKLQVFVIYFHAAIGKFFVTEWVNGTAIYYWFNHSVFGMPKWLNIITTPLLNNAFIISILTYGTLGFELLLCISLLADKKFKKILLIFSLLFHFLIILYLGIFSFFFSILAGLIIYLYPFYNKFKFNFKNEKGKFFILH